MAGKVRIGFVGVGAMGQAAHLRNYVTVDGCEVVALAELREQTGRRAADRYGVPNVYPSAREMLEAEQLDAVVASQPFSRHGQVLEELIPSGLPIFIEKPLAASVDVGSRIVAAAAKHGTGIMVGYHKRSDPATMHAKGEITRLQESGELGQLRYVRLLMPAGDWIANGFLHNVDGGDPRPSLTADAPASDMDDETRKQYISFVNYYIHQVNLLRHLLGETYRVTYADPSGVLLAGQSESGMACTIEMSPYRTSVDWQESAMVCFERGYVRLELPAPLACNRPGRVEILGDPGEGATPVTSSPHLPWVHAMRQQAMNFVDFAAGTAPAPCEAAEALEDLKVAREYIRLWTGK